MELSPLMLAIKTRAAADTGSGGLFNATTPLVTAIWPFRAAEGVTLPYIVFNCEVSGPHAFQKDVARGVVDFHIFVAETATDPLDSLSKIEKRILGDSSAGGVPSFGFHRHPLVFASGSWTPTSMIWEGTTEGDSDVRGVYEVVTSYSLWGSK